MNAAMLGQHHPAMNAMLEAFNGAILMMSFCLLFFLTYYCVAQMRKHNVTVKTVVLGVTVPIGVAFAVALEVEKFGVLVTRLVVWVWRQFGAGDTVPMSFVLMSFLMFGIIVTTIGTMWLIRAVSRIYFGEWPFRLSMILSSACFFIIIARHFFFPR